MSPVIRTTRQLNASEKSDLRFLCSNINDILLIFSECSVKDVFEKEIAAILRTLNENIKKSKYNIDIYMTTFENIQNINL